MREDLLGYLLGALEPDEEREVEDRLEADPELRRKLRAIRRGLEPLSSDDGLIDPPPGLAARACNFVDQPPGFEGLAFDGLPTNTVSGGDESSRHEEAEAHQRPHAPADASEPTASPAASGDAVMRPAAFLSLASSGLQPAVFQPVAEARRWGMADVLVSAGIVAAASMLIVPALSAGRYQAQVTACREKLHRLGTAMVDYSRVRDGKFPEIPANGPFSRAGIYASRLREARLITDYADITCPASGHGPLEAPAGGPAATAGGVLGDTAESNDELEIPELAMLAAASETEVDAMLSRHGGTYGYALGYVDDQGYHVRRNQNRSTFIVLSDMPHDGKSGSRHHGCGGQNVWFEDGHVEFLNTCRLKHLGDQIFENRRGFVGAGVGPDDIVIGRDTSRPLITPVGLAQ